MRWSLSLLGVFLVLSGLFISWNTTAIAETYSLSELQEIAQSQSSDIKDLTRKIESLKLDMDILKTNYYFKMNLSGKPVSITPNLQTNEIEYSGGGTLNGSIKLSLGLELSGSMSLEDAYDDEGRNLDYSLSVKYPIYPGQKTDQVLSQLRQLERELGILQLRLDKAKKETFLQVWKKFHSTLISQERLKLTEISKKEAEEDLKLAKKFYEQGDLTEKELLDGEINYKSSMINYEKNIQSYVNSLKDLLAYVGVEFSNDMDDFYISGSLDELIQLQIISPEMLLEKNLLFEKALENSVTLREMRLDLLNEEEKLDQMKYEFLPKVDSQFDYRPVSNQQEEKYNWSIAISLSYQLIDGGKRSLERVKQKRSIENFKSSTEDMQIGILNELENKLSDLKITYLEVQSAELEYLKAKMDQNIKQEQFAQGVISKLQLSTGERQLRTKELDYLFTKLNYQSLYLDLKLFVYNELQLNGVIK